MAIKNTKNDASDVRIELFRDEENSNVKYGIVNSEKETLNRDDKEPFTLQTSHFLKRPKS